MSDRTYTEALAATEGPHRVILGPVPCRTCGAWVEWAGTDWLGLGSRERHQCEPFLVNGLYRMADAAPRPAARSSVGPGPLLRPVSPPDDVREVIVLLIAAVALIIGLWWWASTTAPHGG